MLNWMSMEDVSFNALLLLERVQLMWLGKMDISKKNLGIALRDNPVVFWYLVNKCPEMSDYFTQAVKLVESSDLECKDKIREAELDILESILDWIVYVLDPKTYDAQPFLNWDSKELTEVVDFRNKKVVDVGSGTGRLALVAAKEDAKAVYAVEPIANLRDYLKEKAKKMNLENVYVVDGLIEEIPFEDDFADVIVAGHVVGGSVEEEIAELRRVVKPGGKIVLCPGNNDNDNEVHEYLLEQGFQWSRFEQPRDGIKRKYWLSL